jgi:pantetheine-phosphate adenylyltransferase
MKTAVYPGSFDPFTNGHMDIMSRALKIFDKVIIAIGLNHSKKSFFSVEERLEMLRLLFKDDPRVEVDTFGGLLIDYLKQRESVAMVRGLRAVSDFEYEFQMANMNRKLHPEAETFFMMTGADHFYISSSMVKEVALLRGNVEGLLPPLVLERLNKKLEALDEDR